MKRIELLSPAGDLERLKITLLYGADAVYIGGYKYSLRANATNFSKEEIKEACDFAHKLGKRVHMTLNIVFHNSDLDGLEEYIDEVVECGIDAFIVSDPCIIHYIKSKYPKVEVHLSTQSSTTNYEAIKFYESIGVDRVVLARELSKEEISEIINKSKCDIEVFIHGAMCTCYSGRCALSNYVTNRDANRGGCAQVCRFAFKTENDDFTLALKDLNMSQYIKDLIDIGVTSLKVEGRMRSLYYLATVIGTYRMIIDDIYNSDYSNMDEYYKILNRVANRETSVHYFNKDSDWTDQYYTGRQEISNQDYLGQVIEYKDNLIKFYERNYFEKGDTIEVFTPNHEKETFVVERLLDDDKNEIDVARHPDNIYYVELKSKIKIPEYSMLRIVKRNK